MAKRQICGSNASVNQMKYLLYSDFIPLGTIVYIHVTYLKKILFTFPNTCYLKDNFVVSEKLKHKWKAAFCKKTFWNRGQPEENNLCELGNNSVLNTKLNDIWKDKLPIKCLCVCPLWDENHRIPFFCWTTVPKEIILMQ